MRMRSQVENRQVRGFTLVEVVVVAAILVVLAVTLGMVVRGGMVKSKQAACASNMRTIGIAMRIYADEHGGMLPGTTHTADLQDSWIYQLQPYLGEFEHARVCPADPKRAQRIAEKGTSYLLNSFLFVPAVDPFGTPTGPALNRLAAIPEPQNTVMAFICSDRFGPGPGNDHTHSERWSSWAAVCADIAVGRFGNATAGDDLQGSTNFLYVDGSVRGFRASELKTRTERGENIAVPPGIDLYS